MQAALKKSGEEKRVESRSDEEGCKDEISVKDNQLESAKAEMGVVREENQRLRMHLNRIMKDYQTLQMQFQEIVNQEAKEISRNMPHKEIEEPADDLISLSLGRTLRDPKKEESLRKGRELDHEKGLALGLHSSSFEMPNKGPGPSTEITSLIPISPENSLEVSKEAGEISCPPSHKVLKTTDQDHDHEVSQQNPVKRARVSVRVRCDTPTINDGCQWRKYGQKIAKGNPCPRAYYRCTIAITCPVRKQVQRCAEDMSILITTYEGTHNHPLPISATAMASTTSAAASMLLSGSSTSGTIPSSSAAAAAASMNFSLSDNSNSKQFYLPSSSFSPSPPYPTITLDLTSTSSSSHFNKFSSNFLSAPRYSSTNLNFNSLESNPLPISFSNNGVLNYRTQVPYNNNNQVGNSVLDFGSRQNQENLYHSLMQKGLNPNPSPSQQTLPADTIAAATKAITLDPTFQSALAAALTSIIGTSNGGGGDGGGNLGFQNTGGENFGKNLNLGETFPNSNFSSTTTNGNNCSSSYLNRPPPLVTNSQNGSMVFLQPPLPFSEGNKSTSPGGERDHVND